jgi:hypothetical protein
MLISKSVINYDKIICFLQCFWIITLFCVRLELFTAVTRKNAAFWDVAPCRSCVNRRFGGTYLLHLQGGKIRDRGTSVSRWLQSALRYVPPKRRFTQNLHGATSQKTAFFIMLLCFSTLLSEVAEIFPFESKRRDLSNWNIPCSFWSHVSVSIFQTILEGLCQQIGWNRLHNTVATAKLMGKWDRQDGTSNEMRPKYYLWHKSREWRRG